jgi:hypothetical protein
MPKAPKGIPENCGDEFVEAVNEAARRGLTVWHLTEQWNGTWACALADPNKNAPGLGNSISYTRQGNTPGAAVRNAMEQFGATDDEKVAAALSKELSEASFLQASVTVKPDVAKDFLRAWETNRRARGL